MISRVADSCFWLTRYLERVDTWSRLLDVTASFSLDVGADASGRWRPLVIVVGQEQDFLDRIGAAGMEDGEVVQHYLVWDDRHPASLFSSMRAVRENARTIREAMSVEMWEAVNQSWLWLTSRAARRLFDRERGAFYERLSSDCMMFHGICYSTMLHEDPFTFMKLGRAVERIGQTARILDVRHHALDESSEIEDESAAMAARWLAILRSCSAYEPFFKRAENVLSGSAVAEFLLFERTFPRSVLHNLDRVRGLLERLRQSDETPRKSPSWERLERLRGSVLQLDMDEVHRQGLHRVATWLVDETAILCDAIHDEFLAPSIESLRARVNRNDRVQARRQIRAQSQFQAQS
ncbi:MAG: alpha-E domain-containing protein [Myxococcota bacterium]